jgi:hypothetical protein
MQQVLPSHLATLSLLQAGKVLNDSVACLVSHIWLLCSSGAVAWCCVRIRRTTICCVSIRISSRRVFTCGLACCGASTPPSATRCTCAAATDAVNAASSPAPRRWWRWRQGAGACRRAGPHTTAAAIAAAASATIIICIIVLERLLLWRWLSCKLSHLCFSLTLCYSCSGGIILVLGRPQRGPQVISRQCARRARATCSASGRGAPRTGQEGRRSRQPGAM